MGKRMNDAERDKMVMLNACGVSAAEIARKTGWSEGGVSNVLTAFDLVKNGEHEELAAKIVGHSLGKDMVSWAYDRIGKEMPQIIKDAVAALSERKAQKNLPEQTVIKEVTETDDDRLYRIIFRAVSDALKAVAG